MEIRPLGDSAAVISYKNRGCGSVIKVTRRDYERIKGLRIAGVRDIVLCFNSIGVYFDRDLITYYELYHQLYSELCCDNRVESEGLEEDSIVIEIPVNYGGEYGPDLDKAACLLNMTADQVVTLHSGCIYNVYGIGFLPGFPYMGDLPDKLILPRKSVPDPAVRAGSVAIAGKQTGIYPFTSPGGWYVIGWTPLKMFDLKRKEPCLVRAGYKVRFIPI